MRHGQRPSAGKLCPIWLPLTGCMSHPLAPHDSVYMGAQRTSQRGWGGLLAQPGPASLLSQDERFIPVLALAGTGSQEPRVGGSLRSGRLRRAQEVGDGS